MKHTPAPWKHEELFDGDESLGITIQAGRDEIAHISSIGHQDFANAALIAAAPELLEASLEALELFSKVPELIEYMDTFHNLRNAINKAT
jgi:hypothetical protein